LYVVQWLGPCDRSGLKIAGVAVAGVDLVTLASSVRERATPDDPGGTVIRLAVRGRALDQPEAPVRKHRSGITVNASA
jgi:hypothetical protein